jgi:hypothetical protein
VSSPAGYLRVGDLVIRSHRLLRTRGTVVRIATPGPRSREQVWVKWDHPRTLPNPSLEHSDTLEPVAELQSPAR